MPGLSLPEMLQNEQRARQTSAKGLVKRARLLEERPIRPVALRFDGGPFPILYLLAHMLMPFSLILQSDNRGFRMSTAFYWHSQLDKQKRSDLRTTKP
jgi:hypothetical protein